MLAFATVISLTGWAAERFGAAAAVNLLLMVALFGSLILILLYYQQVRARRRGRDRAAAGAAGPRGGAGAAAGGAADRQVRRPRRGLGRDGARGARHAGLRPGRPLDLIPVPVGRAAGSGADSGEGEQGARSGEQAMAA